MTLLTLQDAKDYLRVDSNDENALIESMLSSAAHLCTDVARLTPEQWADVDSEKSFSAIYTRSDIAHVRELMKIAIRYALGYLYEHREEADYNDLTRTLRSILFSIREGVF